ncbi:MAG: hypothetical protein WDM80_01145 [Limisphaerales bacterium]
MKKYLAQLRPLERRLAVGALVTVIIVLNAWLIWPHFSDWDKLQARRRIAAQKLQLYQAGIAQTPAYEAQLKTLQSQGDVVPINDMSINMLRTIQNQAAQSGVGIVNTSRQITRTNDCRAGAEHQRHRHRQSIGGFSLQARLRPLDDPVRDLELQPDTPRQHLNANIRLVASYQKNPPAGNLKPATAKAK